SLLVFRLKMAVMAESYGQEFLQVGVHASVPGQVPDFSVMQEQVAQITDTSTPQSFFLHKQNSADRVERLFGHPILEKFHLDFWYTHDISPIRVFQSSYTTTTVHMLALSSVVVQFLLSLPVIELIATSHQLLCALYWVSQGRCSNQSNIINFSTEDYADYFNIYRDGIITGLQHPLFGQQLREHLQWLNTQGLIPYSKETIRLAELASPHKIQPVVIPPAVAASISGSGTAAQTYSPVLLDTIPTTVASTSAPEQYFPAGIASTSPSFSSTQLPSS
ncbi:hypothetical protein J3R83DRAFT_3070, partial [Lanmaoa asiatica]